MKSSKLKDKFRSLAVTLFVFSVFALLIRNTEIDVFKQYLFLPIILFSIIVGIFFANVLVFLILIYFVFGYLFLQNYFLIADKELGKNLVIIFFSVLISLNIIRSLVYLHPETHKYKNKGLLTLFELRASTYQLDAKGMSILFVLNFIKGIYVFKLYIPSLIITFLFYLFFL